MKLNTFKKAIRLIESITNPVVYHITYYRNLDLISDSGLDYEEHGGANFFKPHLQNNSRLGNFFTNDINQIHNWIDTLDYQANHQSDNIFEDGLIPIILKFNINRNTHNKDQHSEYPNSYYTKKLIQPQGIQCWNGKNWIPILQWHQINLNDFVDFIDDFGEQYYELRQDYPLPR